MQLSTNKFNSLKAIAIRPTVGKILLSVLTLSTLVVPSSVFALGIRIPDQDAFATARGNAFTATADNPSAIYYNPAGITQLDGINVRNGLYNIFINDRYEGGGTTVNTSDKLQPVPQLFLTAALPNTPLSLGLGVYSPFGLGLSWHPAPFLTAIPSSLNVPQKGKLQYITVNPVIAYKPCSNFSIAAGFSYNHAESELDFTPGGRGRFSFHGRDDDMGFNAGILWQPLPEHSIGLTYRSETTMDLTGHLSQDILPGPTLGASTKFNFPQTVTAGYSYRPNPNWNFEVDADWADWNRLKSLALVSPLVGTLQTLELDWKSSWMFEFGATRYFGDNWRVSGGYIYSMDSTPDAHFNPIVPDSDRHIFSVGIGKTYKHASWDLTYQLAYGPDRTITTEPAINGTYRFFSHALALSLGYHF
jgi:long-chain fatty acid transport protein